MKNHLKGVLPYSLLALMAVSCTQQPSLKERAEEMQRSILTLDTHVDTPMSLLSSSFDVTKRGTGCVDFPKMKEGALDVESFAVFTPQRSRRQSYIDSMYTKAKLLYNTMHDIAKKNPEIVGIASCPDDMYELKKQGKLAILPTMENSLPVGNDIARIDTLYGLGARMFGLCHSYNNDICDSSSDEKGAEFDGLSPLGEQVVVKLNEIGAMIDVSHASDATFFDVVKLSKTPIVASHSSVRSITNHNRNFSDEMLKALKDNGGVIQICILDAYIKQFPEDPAYKKEINAAREAYYKIPSSDVDAKKKAREQFSEIKARYPEQNAYIKDYVDHIDYVAKKIGVEYVGIGTDFDGGGGVADCKDVSELVGVTAELLSRGYTKEDLEKIWGGNFIRVFNDVIAYSNSLK